MPVLPAVPSTIRPPGFSVPRFSASRMIHSAARSFTDWPGLRNSALPRISHPVASLAALRRMSGVSPMRSSTEPAIMAAKSRADGEGASGNVQTLGNQHHPADHLAGLEVFQHGVGGRERD